MVKSWRNLPPALLAMFALELLSIVAFTTYDLTHSPLEQSNRFELTARGVWLAADVLGAFGALALARRLTGSAATGFRIIAAGFALSLAGSVAWDVIWTLHADTTNIDTLTTVSQWTWFAIKLVPFVGLALATFATHRRLAVAALVAAALTNPPGPLAHHLYGWLVHGWRAQTLLYQVFHAILLAILAAAALALAPEPYPAPPADAIPGLRAISAGLWLRVIAACTFAGLLVLLTLGKAGDGADGVFKLATLSVAVVNAISFIIVGRGALTALVREMPTRALTLAAVANFWCLGVTLGQLPATYELLYGHRSYGGSLEARAQALSIIAPLVAVAAVAGIAVAIAGFAATRGLDQLRAEAQSKGLGFVTLMVASVGIQNWLLPEQTSDGSATFLLLAAATCSLAATVLMARLCTRAADSLHAEITLPTATLRS